MGELRDKAIEAFESADRAPARDVDDSRHMRLSEKFIQLLSDVAGIKATTRDIRHLAPHGRYTIEQDGLRFSIDEAHIPRGPYDPELEFSSHWCEWCAAWIPVFSIVHALADVGRDIAEHTSVHAKTKVEVL